MAAQMTSIPGARRVRICIPIEFRPEGGGFYFLRAFMAFLNKSGWTTCSEVVGRYEVLFTNHWMVARSELCRAIRRNPGVRIVHRIDGSAQDYGRLDDSDERQAAVNQLADLSIFQSRYCRYSTREKFRVIERDGPVIHNPVDIECFRPDGDRESLPGRVRVACVSWSSNPMKGGKEVYAVANANRSVDFMLCGNYPDAPALSNLHRLGVLDRETLARVLRSCDVLLTCSRNEACPNHVLEALASGVPVLYRDSGAMAEVVGDCGLPTTVETFATQLEKILSERETLARRARERALLNFHPGRVFSRYLEAILDALAKPTAVPRGARLRLAWAELARSWIRASGRGSAIHGRKSASLEICYVVPGANWSPDWDGYYVTREIARQFGQPARTVESARGLRRKVVHYGGVWAFLGNLGERAIRRNTIAVTVFHGNRSAEFPELREGMDRLLENAWKAARIHTPCRIMEERLLDWGLERQRLVRIPLGVDTRIFRPRPPEGRRELRVRLGIPAGAFCIGSFQKDGTGWEDGYEPKMIKGPDVLIDTLSQLHKSFQIFVLLSGPSRGFVRRGLERAGVPYRHVFPARYEELPELYACLDLYLTTSREEGGPKGLLEAQACGVAVVSTRVGLAPELIRDGSSGFLAPIGDSARLSELAARLVEDAGLRAAFSESAREHVGDYDWTKIAARYYHELYRPLLEEASATRINRG